MLECRDVPDAIPPTPLPPPGHRFLGPTFQSLAHRNFRLFFFGQLVSNTGNWLTTVALTLLVLKLTGSGLAVGLMSACQFGPILILTAWGGALADRADKRRFLMLTQSLEMVESIGLAVLAFLPHPPLVGLYMLAIVGGTLLAFDNPLRRSFVSEMVPPPDLPNAVVLYSTIVNASRIFGPALAGLLVVTLGYGWAFAIDAASYLAVLACLVAMRPSELRRTAPAARGHGQVRAGLRHVWAVPPLRISFVMLAAIGTLSYNYNVTLPLFVTDSLGRSATVFTILLSVLSAGSVVAALLIAHRALVKMRHIIIGAATMGVTMLILAATPTVATAIPVVFAVGMASILYLTASMALVQLDGRTEMHGRVLALQTVLVAGTTPLGGPLLGWLSDVRGGRAPLVLGGIVCLGAAIYGAIAYRRAGSPPTVLPGEALLIPSTTPPA
jgi:MFS family permease